MKQLAFEFRGDRNERGKVFPGEWYERFPGGSYLAVSLKRKVMHHTTLMENCLERGMP